jgi:hypothetical protein
VTEAEWLACEDPVALLKFLRSSRKASERKLRLFGCACVRLVWLLLGEEPPMAVEAAERFADGSVTKAALHRARRGVREERRGLVAAEAGMRPRWGAYWLAEVVASNNAYGGVIDEMRRLFDILLLEANEWSTICGLLRDVSGRLPFRPIPRLHAAWLRWSDGAILKLAQAIYEDRAFDRLPVLADALEEAGCTDGDLLGHLRGPGPHARGCWVLDLLLGKE